MSDDYWVASVKPKATTNIVAGNTSEDGDSDGVVDEVDDDD